jgi:hypothetical protein
MAEKELQRLTYIEVRALIKKHRRRKSRQRQTVNPRAPERVQWDNRESQWDRAALDHFERDRDDH